MVSMQEPKVGRFSIDVELTNQADLVRAQDGHLASDKVRRTMIRGVVDSGATRLVIPASTAKELGLDLSDTVRVRYADGRTADRQVAKFVQLTFAGRSGLFTAVVEPGRDSALIGAIVMEDLDLLIDCGAQKLVPRDPNRIISEIE